MNTTRDESFGQRLIRITQEVREARKLEDERLARLVREKAERDAAVLLRSEELIEECCQRAEAAARDGKDSVTVKFSGFQDQVTQNDVCDLVLIGLQKIQLRADVANGECFISWDIAVHEPKYSLSVPGTSLGPLLHPPDEPHVQISSFDVATTPVLTRALLAEKNPCEECHHRHIGPESVDETTCFCECHVVSSPRLAPVPT